MRHTLKGGDNSPPCQVTGHRWFSGPYSLKYPHLLCKISLVLFCLETSMQTEEDGNTPCSENNYSIQLSDTLSWPRIFRIIFKTSFGSGDFKFLLSFMLFRTYTIAQRFGNLMWVIWELYQCMHAFIRWYSKNSIMTSLLQPYCWEERLGEL